MAVASVSNVLLNQRREALDAVLQKWDRRLRWQQVSRWLSYSVAPGLALGLLLSFISRTRPWLLPSQIAVATVVGVVVGIVGLLLLAHLWPRERVAVARRIDQTAGLQERLSTA